MLFLIKLKELNLGLDLVTKLQPSQYNYKIQSDDAPKLYGLIAQDLEQSLIDCGVAKNSTSMLQHKEEEDEKESDYSLDYAKLIPILINCIKELDTKVKSLEK